MNNQEKQTFSPERSKHDLKELKDIGTERREQIRENLEKTAENHERGIDDARHEVEQAARKMELEHKEEIDRVTSPAEKRRDVPIREAEREASFKATMREVQDQMSAPSRAFSKIIHNKTVEKISDVTGTTIARPNAILTGAIFAFALTMLVYIVAKNLGYPLSGFETIGAFALGWAIGLCYDFLKVMITGRK